MLGMLVDSGEAIGPDDLDVVARGFGAAGGVAQRHDDAVDLGSPCISS